MKLTNQDTFLIGHARRMREYRSRHEQQNPEEYAHRVKIQQQEYRLRTQSTLLPKHD